MGNKEQETQVHEHSRLAADAVSIGATIGVLAGWLPYIAALASTVYTVIRLYETKTVQDWLKRRKGGKNA